MQGISNDYIAMKLTEARQRELQRESERERLVGVALKRVRLTLRVPRTRIHHN